MKPQEEKLTTFHSLTADFHPFGQSVETDNLSLFLLLCKRHLQHLTSARTRPHPHHNTTDCMKKNPHFFLIHISSHWALKRDNSLGLYCQREAFSAEIPPLPRGTSACHHRTEAGLKEGSRVRLHSQYITQARLCVVWQMLKQTSRKRELHLYTHNPWKSLGNAHNFFPL